MSLINFDNTEIAFQNQTNFELRRTQLLFKTFGNRMLMETGAKLLPLAFKLRLPISLAVKATIYDQFCGGESIEDCLPSIEDLAGRGVGSILDYSVEGMQSEKDFDRTRDEILGTIHFASRRTDVPFSVFKMTGIARFGLLEKIAQKETLTAEESSEFERVVARVRSLCETSADLGVRIMIDAEESWIQSPIDALATQMMKSFNKDQVVVYNTLQMYRKDRLGHLREAIREATQGGYKVGFKLVRGAYMEKERERAAEKGYASPIHSTKAATDSAFDDALHYCMDHVNQIAICSGSHNEQSAYLLVRLIKEKGLDSRDQRIFFSQLLGMSDHITFNLAHHGFNVAKYVPYGPVRLVIPYLIRRAEENSAVKGQTSRELQLVERELHRRTASGTNQNKVLLP